MKLNTNKDSKVLKFFKELSWLLETYKDISIQDVIKALEREQKIGSAPYHLENDTRYLVGVLPQIFQDLELFPKKEDIISFADQVLGISLNVQAKRSRIEYIGTILCQVSMQHKNHEKLVESLEALLQNDSKMKEVKKKIKKSRKEGPNFSWNDTIFNLEF